MNNNIQNMGNGSNVFNACLNSNISSCPETDVPVGVIIRAYLPQILLAIIALTFNVAEIINLCFRKQSLSLSERVLLSLAFADGLFSLLVFVLFIVFMLDDAHSFISSDKVTDLSFQIIQFSINTSIFHVLFISLERLAAITFPLRYKVWTRGRKSKVFPLLIWMFSICLQAGLAMYLFLGIKNEDEEENRNNTINKASGGIMYFSGILLCFIYVFMIYKVVQQTKFLRNVRKTQSHCHTVKLRSKPETVAFVTALVLSVFFLLFTIPIATLMLFDLYVSTLVLSMTQCFLITNSIFNPVAYFWRNNYLKGRKNKEFERTKPTSTEEMSQHSIASIGALTLNVMKLNTTRSCDITAAKKDTCHENGNDVNKSLDGRFRTFTDKWDGHFKYR